MKYCREGIYSRYITPSSSDLSSLLSIFLGFHRTRLLLPYNSSLVQQCNRHSFTGYAALTFLFLPASSHSLNAYLASPSLILVSYTISPSAFLVILGNLTSADWADFLKN